MSSRIKPSIRSLTIGVGLMLRLRHTLVFQLQSIAVLDRRLSIADRDARDVPARCMISGSPIRPMPTPSTTTNSPNSSSPGTKSTCRRLFPEWYADSKRALAIRGSGKEFREGMVDAYRNLAAHMPDNGLQIVMFTHQDAGVWADLALILWAAGLRVTAAWTIATETESALKEGNYVQGTVLMVLRKQTSDDVAFLDEIVPQVEIEVEHQLKSMLELDDQEDPNFSDADYQLAAYAAALRVLTQYQGIEDIDVAYELARERKRGEESPIERIIEDAVQDREQLPGPGGHRRPALEAPLAGGDELGQVQAPLRQQLSLLEPGRARRAVLVIHRTHGPPAASLPSRWRRGARASASFGAEGPWGACAQLPDPAAHAARSIAAMIPAFNWCLVGPPGGGRGRVDQPTFRFPERSQVGNSVLAGICGPSRGLSSPSRCVAGHGSSCTWRAHRLAGKDDADVRVPRPNVRAVVPVERGVIRGRGMLRVQTQPPVTGSAHCCNNGDQPLSQGRVLTGASVGLCTRCGPVGPDACGW